MPHAFIIKTLVTGVKNGNIFDQIHRSDVNDRVIVQDEYTGLMGAIPFGGAVPYGTRIFAGEPCEGTNDRRVIYLQVGSVVAGGEPKTALTYRILRNGERFML